HERRPELRPDAALAQTRDVGMQGFLRPRDVDVGERQVVLLAVLPGKIVVAVDEDRLAMDAQRLLGQLDGLARLRLRLVGAARLRQTLSEQNAHTKDNAKQ